jgi:hypothetical protein
MERTDILRIDVPALVDDPNSLTSGPLQINDQWPGFYLRGIFAMEISSRFLRWIVDAKNEGKDIPPGLEYLATSMRQCLVEQAVPPADDLSGLQG